MNQPVRLSRNLCSAIASALSGSHATLDALFYSAGVLGDAPQLSHARKYHEWLFRIGQDPNVDTLEVLGNIIEELMDTPPFACSEEEHRRWVDNRDRVVAALEDQGLRYFRFGRVIPHDQPPPAETGLSHNAASPEPAKPNSVEDLLHVIVSKLRRAMHPLTHRRKGSQPLSFNSEYDVQDLLHATLRPWISDIRPEEFTPSYAGSSTRMDFLLPKHRLVLETKLVRDRAHAKRLGDEIILDIAHYARHPDCEILWCVIYDPDMLITNADAFLNDLQGAQTTPGGSVSVKIYVV